MNNYEFPKYNIDDRHDEEIRPSNTMMGEFDWQSPDDVLVNRVEIPGSTEAIQVFEGLYLVPSFKKITAEQLLKLTKDVETTNGVVGLDFEVSGYEEGEEIIGADGTLLGYEYPNGVINIDHHIPVPEMARPISTTPLVMKYVETFGILKAGAVINHSDADSILSGLMMVGKLDPEDSSYAEAAIDADHTGNANELADLLVAIEPKRDLQFSLYCLNAYLRDKEIPEEAKALHDARIAQREAVAQLVEDGEMRDMGEGVYLIVSNKKLRSEFFPAAASDAVIFIVACPYVDPKTGKTAIDENGNVTGWEYKIRAGQQFPEGKQLNQMEIPYFGGRWNAGGTIRQGPVPVPPEEYTEDVIRRFNQ